MLNEQQKAELAKPLDRSKVKGRTQGGSQVSYIEGWHAIAEANRIFGFDAWTRETVELRQLGEPRDVNGKMRVDYLARVRISVGDVIRDGCGFGQGIDKDTGQAHESALKEAETDAMKRALMTFGNPFGLALYDKTQASVAEPEPESVRLMLEGIGQCETLSALQVYWQQQAEFVRTSTHKKQLTAAKDARKVAIQAMNSITTGA
jgi:DNA repair and recombination protein RAD52